MFRIFPSFYYILPFFRKSSSHFAIDQSICVHKNKFKLTNYNIVKLVKLKLKKKINSSKVLKKKILKNLCGFRLKKVQLH